MPWAGTSSQRVTTDGKFLRCGEHKYWLKGVTYGPLKPGPHPGFPGDPEQVRRDLAQIRELGANTLRVYEAPSRAFLDLAAEHDLRVLADVAWNKQACFLEDTQWAETARRAVRQAAMECARHPACLGLSIINELPPDVVRWSGAGRVEAFIDELVGIVKEIDPDCLCTFGNYPPTEYLNPAAIDFVCFNVYLHRRIAFDNYLARLQMLADTRPLVLGECGIDSLRHSEAGQAGMLEWQIEGAFRQGVAGLLVFSYTDEWYKEGLPVTDWGFGLTTAAREPKPAARVVRRRFQQAPAPATNGVPKVSVVVAAYNGERTLRACLDSLRRLNYPAWEAILVDDGSTDSTPQIAAAFPEVRYIRQPHAGLSVARNTGIAAAQGEVVAFTDCDCRVDEDWLRCLSETLRSAEYAGVGGHNLLPPEDSTVAAAVMASPGGPAHVMLDDRTAEHIPGCNMAFWRWALEEIGGFDPGFYQAGDDVDVCWRLQQRGYRLGFSPAAFVWHYRRSTVRDYLRQQRGYGEAEAMLERKHPEYFNPWGGSVWRGRIYGPAQVGLTTRSSIIYHGVFGNGLFQSIYSAPSSSGLMLLTSLEYHVLVTLPLALLAVSFAWLAPIAIASASISVAVCVAAAWQARLPRRKESSWSRPLIALLFGLQPIVRGWARYRGRLLPPRSASTSRDALAPANLAREAGIPPTILRYWAPAGFDRLRFLRRALARLEEVHWPHRIDGGWNPFDLEVYGSRWTRLQLTTVSEYCQRGEQVLRCRIETAWTLPAKAALGALLAAAWLVIALGPGRAVWPWLLLLPLPAFVLWLRADQRRLRRIFAGFLDAVANDLGLQPLPAPGAPPAPPKPGSQG